MGGDPASHDGDYMCKESKASIAEAVHNTCVIGRGCEVGGLFMFELSFDFEKWFHQFYYWWHEVHRMGGILPDLGDDGSLLRRLVAVLNWVMAMGWTRHSEDVSDVDRRRHPQLRWNRQQGKPRSEWRRRT